MTLHLRRHFKEYPFGFMLLRSLLQCSTPFLFPVGEELSAAATARRTLVPLLARLLVTSSSESEKEAPPTPLFDNSGTAEAFVSAVAEEAVVTCMPLRRRARSMS
jgi:hypothetical protein